MKIPDDVTELAALEILRCQEFPEPWERLDDIEREILIEDAAKLLKKVSPLIAFYALMEAADAAQGDDLTTAAEVIYDLRVRAAQELADKS